MGEYKPVLVNTENHLILDQALLKLPYELSRNNFKSVQRQIEQAQARIDELLRNGLKNAGNNGDSSKVITAIDQAINRLQLLQKRLETLNQAQESILQRSGARIDHLSALSDIDTLSDVKYEEWSKTRLDRLLVDYLVRNGYTSTAKELADSKNINHLVDIDTFVAAAKIETSIRHHHSVDLALAWCGENKINLKKIDNTLTYDLRLQQYIELIRTANPDKLIEATLFAKKYLQEVPSIEAAGLLAFAYDWDAPNVIEPYKDLFAEDRWNLLADKFIQTHHQLYALPSRSLLNIYLTAGLSSLKTPSCHSKYISPSSGLGGSRSSSPQRMTRTDDESLSSRGILVDEEGEGEHLRQTPATLPNTPVCPICSTELNDLARNLPFAHHTTSQVASDLVALPNGRIYSKARLEELNERIKTPKGYVRDPLDITKIYQSSEIVKVFVM